MLEYNKLFPHSIGQWLLEIYKHLSEAWIRAAIEAIVEVRAHAFNYYLLNATA